ncbi:CoA transferase [Vineibacter terrae]|uniref:CoA transferase n=1 Tax=Vineibacter terrae TaxID=2586908 RepID=A0A5C8PWY3_9HYPH|nr:CoA transferase [Vineibacter terrae]TXL82390.1 CoA transferase [Vineibacter terrae]
MTEALKKRDYAAGATGPLTGLRVMDLSRLVAGNTLTQMLGDYGAEVIKVEPPEGDTLRAWRVEGVETNWKIFARNKKSLAVDFRKAPVRDLLLKLLPSCAVFVESFRPGTLEKMGLAPDTLLAANPRLVIVRISGWGQTGPYSHRPGFGTLVEGMSGFASMNGFEDREPVLPPMYLADTIAGLSGVGAVMMALRAVEVNGGAGQVIDLPLLDPLFNALGPQAANYRLTGAIKPRTGSRSTNAAPRNVYRTRDGGWVCLSASTQGMTERLFRAIDRADLINDPRYRTNADRVQRSEELDAIIGAFVGARTLEETVAYFDAAAVTIGPVYDVNQILRDPHVVEREILADYPDAEMGQFPMHPVIPRLSGTPGSIRSRAPRLGEHNRALLAEIGVSDADYAALKAQGVVIEADLPGARHSSGAPARSAGS